MLQKLTLGGRHSLREFLGQHVWRHFFRDVHVEDPQVASYVADVLVDFAWIDNLYRIRNALGKRLEDVGDYTLFMTGLFPETVARIRKASPPRLESFVDFVKAGKESYAIVSSFDQFEYRHEAPLFRKLSENFELCVYALNLVKQDLERYQAQYYNGLKEVVGESGLT